ncbi:MAG: PilW family protein [Burkholderiaceae bacterium]
MPSRLCVYVLRRASGLTLIELMISLTLGLLVVMSASLLLLTSKNSYQVQDESSRLQETGRYALELIALSAHQAGYENWEAETGAMVNDPTASASMQGLDAHTLKSGDEGITNAIPSSVNGSDVLALRFIGSGTGTVADGTVLNCAGFAVPMPVDFERDRGWSIFYVGMDASDEPELRCKYRGKSAWNSEAVARGVESFQVLYGVDTDMDRVPNRFMSAQEVDALDHGLVLEGHNAVERMLDRNRKTAWKRITAIQVALLVRSAPGVRSGERSQRFDLFGESYASYSGLDRGTSISEADLPRKELGRMRKAFRSIIYLRNAEGSNAP